MSLPPTKTRVFTNPGAVALDAQGTGMPNFAPLLLDVLVTTAPGALTVTHEDGTALVYAALPLGPFRIPGPIKAIVSSTTVIVTATWWAEPGLPSRDPQYFNPRL